MLGSPRIEVPGAFYHVLARGDPREPIVLGDNRSALVAQILMEHTSLRHQWIVATLHMDRPPT